MSEAELLRRKLERERKARHEAERLLETMSGQLYDANEQLKTINAELNARVAERSRELLESNRHLEAEVSRRRDVERELRLQLSILHGATEISLDGILVVGADRRWLRVNQRFLDMWGLSDLEGEKRSEEMIRVVQSQVRDKDLFQSRIEHLYAHPGDTSEEEIELLDGRVLDRYTAPIRDEAGQISGRIWFYRDVTAERVAQRALEDSEERFRNVFEHSNDGIVLYDLEGQIFEVNETSLRLLGYDRHELLGAQVTKLHPPEQIDSALSAFKTVSARSAYTFETQFLRRDGDSFPAEVSARAFMLSGRQVVQEVIRDISERKRGEQSLREAKEAAESANQAKSLFLATVSHEMRTPLNVILGSTELALGMELQTPVRERLDRIDANAKVLLRLISDLLDLSKIESGQIDIDQHPFVFVQTLRGALEPVRERAVAKGLDFRLRLGENLPQTVVGDAGRFSQVLVNLAENAVKFTESGLVAVEVEPAARGQLRVSVRDTGRGMSAGEIDRAFEKFVQVGARAPGVSGVGLGLSIVRSLVEAMGGLLRLESQSGAGSTFEIVLPLEEATPTEYDQEDQRFQRAGRSFQGLILVAEDSDDSFDVTRLFLEGAGYEVTRARTGLEAVRMSDVTRYDLILMDLDMPDLDGFGATERIREAERRLGQPPVPILATTAHALGGYREHCLAAGMNDYVSKPVTRRDLLDSVKRNIALRPYVLVVDAADAASGRMEDNLREQGYHVARAHGLSEALEAASRVRPIAVLLKLEGNATLRAASELRQLPHGSRLRIVGLTESSAPEAGTVARQQGCDVGISSRCSQQELLRVLAAQLMEAALASRLTPQSGAPNLSAAVEVDPDVADLVPRFLEKRRVDIELIRKAVSSAEWETAARLGHTMKGSGSAYGFPAITKFGQQIERHAKKRDTQGVRAVVGELAEYLASIRLTLDES